MTFLKKLGQTLLQIGADVTGFGPIITSITGTISPKAAAVETRVMDTVTQIGGIVTSAETMFAAVSSPDAKTGSQKLAAATPLVAQVIKSADFMVSKHINDEALFIQGCQKITGGMADVLNSLGH